MAAMADVGVAGFIIGTVAGVTAGDMRIPAIDIDDAAMIVAMLAADNGAENKAPCAGKDRCFFSGDRRRWPDWRTRNRWQEQLLRGARLRPSL
jgi:hypothetical protein